MSRGHPMIRVPLLLLLFAGGAGCSQPRVCKAGTVLVSFSLAGASTAATAIEVAITVGSGTQKSSSLPLRPSTRQGSIEVDFPAGYPLHQAVTVTLTADGAAGALGTASGATTLTGSCAALDLTLGGASPPDASATPSDGAVTDRGDGGAVCSNTTSQRPTTDPGYRVIVTSNAGAERTFPASNTSWQVEYQFEVPPLPCSSTWNYTNQTFYVWGGLDFDEYGSSGTYPLSAYVFNQIVPEISIGNSVAGNDSSYGIVGQAFPSWVIHAEYYWQSNQGTPYALAGNIVHVNPGDRITSLITYNANAGTIVASITAPEGTSSITIARPFLDESSPPFASWTDFFKAAENRSSASLQARPMINVETHYVDQATLCPILPLEIDGFSAPNTPIGAANFATTTAGGLSCPPPLTIFK